MLHWEEGLRVGVQDDSLPLGQAVGDVGNVTHLLAEGQVFTLVEGERRGEKGRGGEGRGGAAHSSVNARVHAQHKLLHLQVGASRGEVRSVVRNLQNSGKHFAHSLSDRFVR